MVYLHVPSKNSGNLAWTIPYRFLMVKLHVIAEESFDVQGGFDDVYRIFLVDTPIGAYFEEYLKEADRDKDDMARAGIETSQVGSVSVVGGWLGTKSREEEIYPTWLWLDG